MVGQWHGEKEVNNMTNYQLIFTAQNLQLTRYLRATDSNDAMQQVRSAFPHDVVTFVSVNTIAGIDIPVTEAFDLANCNNGMAPLTQQGG